MSNAVSTTGILVKRQSKTPIALTSNSIANPTVVTTAVPHGFQTGETVTISGNTGSSPTINAALVATRIDATHFSVPVNVTTGGTGGSAAASATFQTVAEIIKVTPPGYSRNKIETSTHNDGTESYILGILRQSDAALGVNYIAADATHIALLSDIQNNQVANWKVLLPSGVQLDGPGRIQMFKLADAGIDGAQQADLAITWSGPIVQS